MVSGRFCNSFPCARRLRRRRLREIAETGLIANGGAVMGRRLESTDAGAAAKTPRGRRGGEYGAYGSRSLQRVLQPPGGLPGTAGVEEARKEKTGSRRSEEARAVMAWQPCAVRAFAFLRPPLAVLASDCPASSSCYSYSRFAGFGGYEGFSLFAPS